MKVHFLPKTALGKWSIGLIVGSLIFFLLTMLLGASGQRGGDTFFSNLALAIPILLAGISGISAFFTGIIGIIKSKDRSVIVFIATIIGFFVLFWLLAEVLVPH
jgi:hypothetical protein